jgi:ABC-type nitrate/sulfonate/bicarbonate transport system substrate-binding protein
MASVIIVLTLVLLATAPVFFSTKQAAAQASLEKIAIAYPSVSSTGGVVPWIAKDRGFFTAHGMDDELIYTAGAMSLQ